MRLQIIRFFYFLSVFIIVLRLGFWQIILADDLSAKAENQRLVQRDIYSERGTIFFKDGSVLASVQPVFLVFAQPKLIPENGKKDFSRNVAYILAEEQNSNQSVTKQLEEEILKKINKDVYWISLRSRIGVETKKKLEKLNLEGLGFEQSSTRFYPEGSSSAHLLGFVGLDAYGVDTGYFGLEGYYNGELKGQKGTVTEEKDAVGLPILIGKFITRQPKKGKNLKLNVDRSVQYIIEEKLKKGVEKYGAKGGSVVVMEPESGNILALSSMPSYDPVKPNQSPKDSFKNPVVADGYEPGSTFKVLVMAAAINEGVVKPDTLCDFCSGPVDIGEHTIRTWNNKYKKDLTMTDAIVYSDNIGMIFAGKRLGVEKLYSYINKFGFGVLTNIDLQDESSPSMKDIKDFREIELATTSFGQGISTTAVQIIRAVSAVANGGNLMEPHVVAEILDWEEVFKIKPKIINQPISEDTAKIITDMMVKAVDEGEAKWAKPKGYKIAGKTGTAQIPVAGHYDPNKTIASFVGFAPADDPKFVMLVRYVEPTSSIFGADTAAPTFFEIAKELFLYYGIAPSE